MVAEPILSVYETDDPSLNRPSGTQSGGSGGAGAWEVTSLEAARAAVGVVLVPSTVPEGFQRSEVILAFGQHVIQVYSNGTRSFQIQQSPRAKIAVKSGSAVTGSVLGTRAVMVRGVWISVNGGALRWDPGFSNSVLLELENRAVEITSRGNSPVDMGTLTQVAESLQISR